MKNLYMTKEDSNRVKGYIVSAGYNITSLAAAIKMSRESLSMRISGKVDFGRREMNDIARILNIPPETIFFNEKVS